MATEETNGSLVLDAIEEKNNGSSSRVGNPYATYPSPELWEMQEGLPEGKRFPEGITSGRKYVIAWFYRHIVENLGFTTQEQMYDLINQVYEYMLNYEKELQEQEYNVLLEKLKSNPAFVQRAKKDLK